MSGPLPVAKCSADEVDPRTTILLMLSQEIEKIFGGSRHVVTEPEKRRLVSMASCALERFGGRVRRHD